MYNSVVLTVHILHKNRRVLLPPVAEVVCFHNSEHFCANISVITEPNIQEQNSYLEYPVVGAVCVEDVEPVISGESDQAVGEDVPVADTHPRHLANIDIQKYRYK